MSHLSLESKFIKLRSDLEKWNSELFKILTFRRNVAIEIQKLKESKGHYQNFDPQREIEVFKKFENQLMTLSEKELLAFSLVMEDQAMALESDNYPAWSRFVHLSSHKNELFEMINPTILKVIRPNAFNRLLLTPEFSFLKDF